MPSPALPLRPLRLVATGISTPERWVDSVELDRQLGLPAGTVLARTGVRRRGFEPRRTAAEVAAEAAHAALTAAALELADIDCLVSANAGPEQALPCNAAFLHRELGLKRVPAFDVDATCLSFLLGLDLVAALLAAGRYRRVLLVSCDIASHALDPADPETFGLFGDGAAAVLLELGAGLTGLRALRLETWSEHVQACGIAGGGSRLPPQADGTDYWQACRFRMDGRRLYRATAEHFDRFVAATLTEAGVGLGQIDRVIPHQASLLGMAHVFKRLRIPAERIEDIFASHGNQVAASLPTALHHALESGRLQRGDTALLLGTAAGITLGAAVLQL